MSEPIRVGDLMRQTPEYRKLLKLKRPENLKAPWPDAVTDGDTVVAQCRGPAPTHQCWQALALYREGKSLQEIATTLSIEEPQAREWIRQALKVRS